MNNIIWLIGAIVVVLAILSFLGLRYPVQMLPVLLFESAWKLIWLTIVALPLWTADAMDAETLAMTFAVLWVVIVLAVIPWRFVVEQYVRKQGDRWGPARR